MSANTEYDIDWVEVSEEEYYRFLADKNIVSHELIGAWPYTGLLKLSNRQIVAKRVAYLPEGKGLPETRYYIPKNRLAEIRKVA